VKHQFFVVNFENKAHVCTHKLWTHPTWGEMKNEVVHSLCFGWLYIVQKLYKKV
jgi:hypothetical protein